jgi:hypothetical protein
VPASNAAARLALPWALLTVTLLLPLSLTLAGLAAATLALFTTASLALIAVHCVLGRLNILQRAVERFQLIVLLLQLAEVVGHLLQRIGRLLLLALL